MKSIISARGLAFTYPGATRPALQGLDFDIGPAEILVFTGSRGCGKSTLQRIFAGLIREYAGTASFQGRELHEWSRDYFRHIGAVLDFPGHFLQLTAEENLAFFAGLHGGETETIPRMLEKVGLAGEGRGKVRDFSTEMMAQLGVARACIHRPTALFLDDPTLGLGHEDARLIKELIRAEKAAGRSILLTTADMAIAEELGDRIVTLADGGKPA